MKWFHISFGVGALYGGHCLFSHVAFIFFMLPVAVGHSKLLFCNIVVAYVVILL